MERVAFAGLGRISRHHLEALEPIAGIDVVGGCDPAPGRRLVFRGAGRPVFASPDELAALAPTTVVVATPTAVHHETCVRILSWPERPARLLVEKPMASSLEQVEELSARSGALTEISVLYHAAYAPEVLWALARKDEWIAEHGRITGYESSFADPYRDLDPDIREKSHVSSWLDSGINALSVAQRFVSLIGVERLVRAGSGPSVYQAELGFRSGPDTGRLRLRTSWDVPVAAKSSELVLESGAEILLDHQAVTGVVRHRGAVLDSFEYRGDVARLTLHYQGLFRALFLDGERVSAAESLFLHRLLFAAPA